MLEAVSTLNRKTNLLAFQSGSEELWVKTCFAFLNVTAEVISSYL